MLTTTAYKIFSILNNVENEKAPFICVLMILLSFTCVKGQENNSSSINPADPAFRQKFSHLDFGGKFYIMAVKDAVNNYYMADFSQLPLKFERVYFINLVYKSGKIVNIDSDLSQDRVWFLVNKKYSDKEAGAEFDRLKEQTLNASVTFTEKEKADFLLKNTKIK